MALTTVRPEGLGFVNGRRNLIINGAMQVAQRGTSAAVTTSSGYFTADRFRTTATSDTAGRHTQSQATITDLPGFANAIKLDCTTADTSIAAGEILVLATRFEGQNLQSLAKGTSSAKSVTVSFYAKGTAKKYMCELTDQDNTRSIRQQFTVSSSWQRFSIVFPGDTTGAFDDDNALSSILGFWLHAGSTYSGGSYTANTWASTVTNTRASGIDSFFSSTDNELFITGIQMEIGSSASDFEHRSFGEELSACQRYYQKSYIDGVAVGTVTQVGCSMDPVPTSGNTWRYTHNFTSHMRATPTYTFYVPDTGTSGFGGFEGAGDTNKEAILVAFSSNKSGVYYSTSMDQTGFFMWHYELNSEL